MSYYNYHAIAKNLLLTGHCFAVIKFKKYHHILNAMVLYFDNHRPIPIREYRWHEYIPIIEQLKLTIQENEDL